jgi:hypothetical protein
MRFLKLSLLPNGAVLENSLRFSEELPWQELEAWRSAMANEVSRRIWPAPGFPTLDVQCTASEEGVALASLSVEGALITSSLILAGRSPVEESQILDMFYTSASAMAEEKGLSEDGLAFVDFLTREERPALFSVVWPTLEPSVIERFANADVYLASAFFSILAVERNA